MAALRNDAELVAVSRVWPFETGLGRLPNREYLIVLEEIYPSLVPIQTVPGEVKDALQVQATASHFAALDGAGELSALFAGPDLLAADERLRIESEEGWTLGVLSRRAAKAPSPIETRPVTKPPKEMVSASGIPDCNFVYFAMPACAPETITAEFVNSAEATFQQMTEFVDLRADARFLRFEAFNRGVDDFSCELLRHLDGSTSRSF